MKRIVGLALTVGLGVAGCRAAPPIARSVDPDLQLGAMAHRTDFERGYVDDEMVTPSSGEVTPAKQSPAPAPADTSSAAAEGDSASAATSWPSNVDRIDDDDDQRRRIALFWSGVGILAVGLVATGSFMTVGQVAEGRLDEGYDEGGLSRDREQRLRNAGTLSNQLAIVSGGVSVLGLALLLAGYGLDYSVCGKLAKRRKKCRNR